MQPVQIIVIASLVAVITALAFFIIRSMLVPKKIEGIKKLTAQKKYSAAIKLGKSLLAKDKKDINAHYYVALAYLADNQGERALDEFSFIAKNAIFGETSFSEAEFRKQFASLYLKFNKSEEALKEYLLLTKIEPGESDNFFNAGKLLERFNRRDQAIYFYQTAIKLNRRHAKAHAALGVILFKSKQLGEAQKEIERAISLSPETFSNYFYQGKIYKELKDYPKAVNSLEKALRDPEYKQRALLERGTCFIAANNMDRAIVEFDRAIRASKDDGTQETLYARYFLASCYEKMRKIEPAIEQWMKIQAKNKAFKDVPAKLTQYRDITTNDGMKEYMTSSSSHFVDVCRQAVEKGMNLVPQSVEGAPFGCVIIANEPKTDNWMSVRQKVFLIHFYRDTDTIEESVVRSIVDEVKKQNYSSAILCTDNAFSPSAISFAENRPVELVNRERLEAILGKSGA